MFKSESSSPYSLHKSHKILKEANAIYAKRWRELAPQELERVESELKQLEEAIGQKNRVEADRRARSLNERFISVYATKSPFAYFKELVIAIVVALIIATVVRQMWFELYEIPTGSMRPTFKERDHLIVSKTTFGINFPLRTDHLYFDPNLVQRASVLIFSGDGIDLPDTETTYFGIFPYKKRYIKRCLAKPGDIVYFYGGKIYGIDKEGNDLGLADSPWLKKIDHVPYINLEGRMASGPTQEDHAVSQIVFKQMNKPIGRLVLSSVGETEGEIFNGKSWAIDRPSSQDKPHTELETYMDFWGMKNFAMARLLTKEQVEKIDPKLLKEAESAPLYLELRHNPSLTYPKPRFLRDAFGNFAVALSPYVSIIPLQEEQLKALMDNMYTARIVVKNGRAHRFSAEKDRFTGTSPSFPGIPDGTYEFYYGKGSEVLWGGITRDLPKDHPLYSHKPENIQRLFNIGIEVSANYEPTSANQLYFPSRYAYFRDGDLYLLGAPIFKKNDPVLVKFNEQEMKKESEAKVNAPYIAFKDYGPPLKEGKVDADFLKIFGFKIPEKHYLVLGDNFAMSADSRYFGTVPESNLQGSPSFILWPPEDVGTPNQKPYPWLSLPSVIVWSVAALIAAVWYALFLRSQRRPVFRKLSP